MSHGQPSVLLTGATGRIGTAVIDAGIADGWRLLDRRGHPDLEVIQAEITDLDAMTAAMEGVGSLVHLAATSAVDAPWEEVLRSNIIGMRQVMRIARAAEVESVVFASSNHVVGSAETELLTGEGAPRPQSVIDHHTDVRPDSLYAVSKAFGEALLRYAVENHRYPSHGYAIRFGSVRDPWYDHPFGDAERGVHRGRWGRDDEAYRQAHRRMHAMWQSRRDAAAIIGACLADRSVSFDVFYGVSDNETRWLDIDHAREVIGYTPRDSADTWEAPPSGGVRQVTETVWDGERPPQS